ncbi:MAG: hypothetical protein AAGA87_12890 [Pseudomonadota bacterium]
MSGRHEAGHTVTVRMPTKTDRDAAEAIFAGPMTRNLSDAGLGSVERMEIQQDDRGEPEDVILTLRLVTRAERALTRVETMLQDMDAPVGSTLCVDGSKEDRSFGKSHGLGIYLLTAGITEDDRLDIVELCTDAMEGTGLYQGSAQIGDRTALYFYGDSFNRMRAALTFVITHDPRCKYAITRRLT